MTNDQPYACPLCGWSFVPAGPYDEREQVAEHDDKRHGIPRATA